MTGDGSGDGQNAELDRLRRQYAQWRIWRGRATGHYWAMPPRGHPVERELIGAREISELAELIARAEGWHGP